MLAVAGEPEKPDFTDLILVVRGKRRGFLRIARADIVCGMRTKFLISLVCLLPLAGARADAVGDFDKIVTTCESGVDKAADCEKAIWAFGDVAKDDKLSVAELSRLARMFGEVMERRQGGAGGFSPDRTASRSVPCRWRCCWVR